MNKINDTIPNYTDTVKISNIKCHALALAFFVTWRVFVPGLLFLCVTGCATNSLSFAAARGDATAVDALIAKGVDVNASRLSGGMTTLMFACQIDNLRIVQALLAKGADVNAKNDYGRTPLMMATCGPLKYKMEGSSGGGTMWKMDLDAPPHGDLSVVRALLDSGADVNARQNDGTTALMIATQGGQKDIVELLRQHGAHE
jgi:hypothetical protein